MADAQIFPLLGHTALIDVYELTRSFHELLDIPSAKHTNVADIMLTHPPILMIEEGRGERLLNHDSVKKQLSYHNKTQRNEFSGNLRCFLIDPSVIDDNNIRVLYNFLFGQIQKLYYVKKQGGTPLWKIVMQQVETDEHLKNIIEKNLFDGEDLAPRHYQKLLMAAQVGDSSINQELAKIRRKKLKNNAGEASNISIEKPSAVIINKSKGKNKNSNHGDPITSNENQKENQKNFNMKESLANITRAADKSVRRSSYEQSVGEEDV